MTSLLPVAAVSLAFSLAFFPSAVLAAPDHPPVGVPADARHFDGKWYRVYFERGTWAHAKDRCATFGGQLATVPDEATWTFVQGLAGTAYLWLGATDEKEEGKWVWVDGTPMQFTAWAEGEPNTGDRSQNYLHIWHGGWADATSNSKAVAGFICQWKDK
jgi:hypothetical protein